MFLIRGALIRCAKKVLKYFTYNLNYTFFQILFFIASRSLVLVSVSSETLLWKGMWELLDLVHISVYLALISKYKAYQELKATNDN